MPKCSAQIALLTDSAYGSIAEYPDRVKQLFKTRDVTKNGLYLLHMNVDGEFKDILIDDHVPTTS